MATKAKKPALSADELSQAKALADFLKANKDKKLTDAQKETKRKLQDALGRTKFVRIANKRIPKALKAISGIANLAGRQYVKTEAQVKAICDALDAECKALRHALLGGKAADSGFTLPGFEDQQKQ